MKIMFGKHKGKELSEIPVEYLQWLIENSDVNDPKYGAKNQILVTACERQIASNVPAEDKKYYAKMAATNKANAKPPMTPALKSLVGPKEIRTASEMALADLSAYIEEIYNHAARARELLNNFYGNDNPDDGSEHTPF